MKSKEFDKRFIAARRAAIGLDFLHLNDVQREAAMTVDGALLLLAGAGSGKTTVLINRIANLLRYGQGSDSGQVPPEADEDDLALLEAYIKNPSEESRGKTLRLCEVDPVEPWRIIAITFTNKAANEMKERLARMLGPGADDIWAMTFHAACTRMLRRDIDKLGYDKSFTIYDTADASSLMKRILKEMEIEERNLPHRTVLGYISRAKNEMIAAEDFYESAAKTGDLRRKMIGDAYLEYSKRMKASNALDFDDLLLLAVRLLMEHPEVAQNYQNRFSHVLVDEYQDTNSLQYMLVSMLSRGYGNICVVGDDDQSIYKFRGATIENILNFEKQFRDSRVIRLEQNYRSTGFILDAASDVIRNNKGRKGKELWTDKGPGIKPALHVTSDERDEARFVADTILSSYTEGRGWQEHAVLYRMNAQSNQLESAFKRAGIPYRVYGGTGFYERAEIKDMLAYLCLIHNPADDVRLLRVVNTPARGIGQTTMGRMAEIASQTGTPIFNVIRDSHNIDALQASAGRLHKFADMIDELRALSASIPLDELYDELIEKSGYVRMLESKGSDENLSRMENVKELKTNILGFMNENGGSLFDFLSETALYTDLDSDEQGADRVLMMTMHSAKGLEFDTVFIVGAEEGVFPNSRAIGEPGEMEEERRLCYVAMTRAMRRLIFTSARQRMLFGKTSSSQPSRFVGEIEKENIDINIPRFAYGFDFEAEGGFASHSAGGAAGGGYGSGAGRGAGYGVRRFQGAGKPAKASNLFAGRPDSGERESVQYEKGDKVEHSAFGSGIIMEITPAGGDALLEIEFATEGTKRLLLNSASRYMSKV